MDLYILDEKKTFLLGYVQCTCLIVKLFFRKQQLYFAFTSNIKMTSINYLSTFNKTSFISSWENKRFVPLGKYLYFN